MGFRPDPQQPATVTSRFRPDPPADAVAAGAEDILGVDRMAELAAGVARPLRSPEPSMLKPIGKYAAGVDEAAGVFNRAKPAGLLGVGDAALSTLTGMVAPGVGAIRSAITGEPYEQAAEESIYQPRTESGQAQLGLLGSLLKPLTDSGADVALAGLVPDVPPMVASSAPRAPKVPKPIPEGRAQLTKMRGQGLKVTPAEASKITGDKNFIGRILQAVGGDTKVMQDMASKNAPVVNEMARKAVGADSLTEAGLKPVKEAGNAAYKEMASLGAVDPTPELVKALEGARSGAGKSTKRNAKIDRLVDGVLSEYQSGAVDAGQVVERVRELRKQSARNIAQKAGEKPDPQLQAQGHAERQLADALDDFLEYNAAAAGKPELAEAYKANRVKLAKVGTVEGASRAGNINPKKLYSAKEGGAPLSGELDDIATAHEYAPGSVGPSGAETLLEAPGRNLNWLETLAAIPQNVVRHSGVNRLIQSDIYQNAIAGKPAKRPAEPQDWFPGATPPEAPPAPTPPAPPTAAPDFAGELGLAPDVAYETLPGGVQAPVNGRALAEALGLQLEEQVQPAGIGPARGRLPGYGDEIEFEPPGDVQPYQPFTPGERFSQSVSDPAGASVTDPSIGDAGRLELAPDYQPGPYQEMPPAPRGRPRQGGAPQEPAPRPAPQAAAPEITPEGLSELGALIDQMLNTKRAQPTKVTGYRGVPEGVDPFDASNTHGNALFFTPDEATARNYGSNVVSKDLEFSNLLQTPGDTLEAVRQALGLQDSAELLDIIAAARNAGHDGVTYDLKPGREYIQIPGKQ